MEGAKKNVLACGRAAIALLLVLGMLLFGVPITRAQADNLQGSCGKDSNCTWDFYDGELTLLAGDDEPAVFDWASIVDSGGVFPGLMLAMR